MGRIAGILVMLILLVGIIPFPPEAKIEWTVYLGMPLVILTGSAGIAFLSKRIEAIIGGIILAALWPVLLKMI